MASEACCSSNFDSLLVPTEFSICRIYISCAEQSAGFAKTLGYETNKEITLTLGLAATSNGRNIDSNLLQMRAGESTSLTLMHEENPSSVDLTLVNFESSRRVFELAVLDILERAKILKETGTVAFEKKEIETAFYLYGRSMKYITCALVEMKSKGQNDDNIKQDLQSLKCLCHLNLAACQLLGTNTDGVIKNCTEALLVEPRNVKALFRRSQAHAKRKEYDKAIADLNKALEFDPNNKAVGNMLLKTKKFQQSENLLLASNLKGIFG